MSYKIVIYTKGAFTNYVYKICLFLTTYPLRLLFLWYKNLQKVNFFDPLPPSSCKRSLWTPPKAKSTYHWYFQNHLPTSFCQRSLSTTPQCSALLLLLNAAVCLVQKLIFEPNSKLNLFYQIEYLHIIWFEWKTYFIAIYVCRLKG